MTETARNIAPKHSLPILGTVLGVLIGVIFGIALLDATAYAVLAGVTASWLIGIFIVAPKAGAIAKHRFFQAFTSPDPQDQAMIEGATVALVQGMGGMAARALEDDELGNNLKQAFYPVFDLVGKRVNQRWDMAMHNISAQKARGAGVFNPGDQGDDEFNQGLMERIMGIFEGPMDALGIEGKFKEACRQKIAFEFMGGQNNGPGGRSSQAPPAIAGNQGKGW